MFKMICPYCGGPCETFGGSDGNPFNKGRKETTVCTACGRTTSTSEPSQISEDDLKKWMTDEELQELLLDADIITADVTDADTNDVDIAEADITIADTTAAVMTVADIINSSEIMLKISATAEGGGVKRNAETTVSVLDGSYSLGNDYPFGRRDIDRKPPFSLCSITVKGNEIAIAGETFTIKELPKTITRKLTAYGHGYVPWEEIITIRISIE